MKPTPRDEHQNAIGFGTRRLGWFKGQYYWETQIFWLVVMWQHDGALQRSKRPGRLRLGRLLLWNGHYWDLNRRGHPVLATILMLALTVLPLLAW